MPALTERDKYLIKGAIGNPESTQSIIDAIEDSITAEDAQEIVDEGILVTTITLTSAQILALSNTDLIEVIPSPGEGKAIVINYVVSKLHFNTTPYVAPVDAVGFYLIPTDVATEFANSWQWVAKDNLLTSSESVVKMYINTMPDDTTLLEGSGFSIACVPDGGSVDAYTDGDSTVTAKIYYTISEV